MMKQERAIDVNAEQYAMLRDIIKSRIPYNEVWAYGSRVKWIAGGYSDLDLVVMDCTPENLSDLREVLEESNLPLTVSVMGWEEMPEHFKSNIKENYVVFQKPSFPVGWRVVSLGELISKGVYSIKNDLREPLSKMQRSEMQGEFPYYGAAGQIDSINKFKLDGFHLLVGEDGTVTSDGEKPMLQLVDGQFWVSNHAHILQGKTKQDTKSLYYMLNNVNITPYITGAVQPKLSKGNLLKIKLTLPPVSEQAAIAGLLGNLDDKIDLLHRQNKTLEATAKTIFRQMFIDNICPGSEELPLSKIVTIRYGKYLPTLKLTKTGYPVLGAGKQIGFYTEYSYETPQVLISCRGNAGTVKISPPKAFITSNSLILERKEVVTFEFLKYRALLTDFSPYVSGSVQPQITIEDLSKAPIIVPPKSEIVKFSGYVRDIEGRILNNNLEISTLEKFRNLLLPKLINGTIRVQI